MTNEEWINLKHGDKVQHKDGDINIVYISDGIQYLTYENHTKPYDLFPFTEFDHTEWKKISK